MTIIAPPQFQINDLAEPNECECACREAFERLVDVLASRGWRRKELAVLLADIADDFVLQMASQLPSTVCSIDTMEMAPIAG